MVMIEGIIKCPRSFKMRAIDLVACIHIIIKCFVSQMKMSYCDNAWEGT